MSAHALRLLGFAFASADLLFEIDTDGRIALALGAAAKLTGSNEQQLAGSDWRELVHPADASLAEALAAGLDDGGRFRHLRYIAEKPKGGTGSGR